MFNELSNGMCSSAAPSDCNCWNGTDEGRYSRRERDGGGREREREREREGGRERGRERGREKEREGEREGGREGGREGERERREIRLNETKIVYTCTVYFVLSEWVWTLKVKEPKRIDY